MSWGFVRSKINIPRVVAALRYRDVEQAAAWLCRAFAFEPHSSTVDDDGRVEAIQLTHGDSLIMLLLVGTSELDLLMKQPDELGGAATQSCYIVVGDIDAHFGRAKVAGAEMIGEVKSFESGGGGYTCRDLEGHIWNFGTYDPWVAAPGASGPTSRTHRATKRLSRPAFFGALVGVAGVAAVTGWGLQSLTSLNADRLRLDLAAAKDSADRAEARASSQARELEQERGANVALEKDARLAREQLAQERAARKPLERSLRQRDAKNAEQLRARTAAEKAAATAEERAGSERRAREAAERSAATAQKDLVLAKAALAKVERAAQDSAERLAQERSLREAAEQAAKDAASTPARGVDPPSEGAAPSKKPGAQGPTARKAANSSAVRPVPPMPSLVP